MPGSSSPPSRASRVKTRIRRVSSLALPHLLVWDRGLRARLVSNCPGWLRLQPSCWYELLFAGSPQCQLGVKRIG